MQNKIIGQQNNVKDVPLFFSLGGKTGQEHPFMETLYSKNAFAPIFLKRASGNKNSPLD